MRRAALCAAVLAVLLATGCSRGPDDVAVANEVKAKLFSDDVLKTTNLTVVSKEGIVTLSGEVPSESARYQAFKMATESKGVVRVEDKMTVAVAQAAVPAPPAEPAPATRASTPAPRPRPAAPAASAASAPASAPAPAPTPASTSPAPAPAPAPAPPEPPKPVDVEIPAGTRVVVRMIDGVDTEVNKAGEKFRASLDEPIVIDGQTVVPSGADVTVEVSEMRSAGRMAGRSELRLHAVRFELQGKSYALSTDVHELVGAGEGSKTATKVGIGAAAGAAIGAIAGGGKGAAIGAAVGAGAGTAASATKKGEQIKVPSETRVTFTTQAPVTVTYLPSANKNQRRPA